MGLRHLKRHHFATIAAIVCVIFVWKMTHAATTYYVAPNGNDGSPGTLAQPWATIQHAANSVQAGDTVLVRGGVYAERVTLSVSGNSADGFITFQNYPNELPILDGTNLTVPDAYNGLFFLENISYVRIEGFELRNYRSTQNWRTAVGIHVRGAGSHIQLVNNVIHDIRSTPSNTSDAHGIAVYGTQAPQSINNLLIEGNELYDLELYWSEALVLNGNVEQFVIRNNRVHDADNIGIDLIGFEGTASDPYDQARDGVVEGNIVYNIDSLGNAAYGGFRSAGGIYVDGGTRIVIERNIVSTSNIGIEIASEHDNRATSDITVRNNVIYNNHIAGLAMGGYDELRGSTENCQIINNTFYHNDTDRDGNGEIWIQFDTRNNVIKNNILWAGTDSILITNYYAESVNNVVDFNLYFAPDSAEFSNWSWQDTYYEGFATWQTATGNDVNSQFLDPQFVSTRELDWHIQTTSPAVDSGDNSVNSGLFDIDGTTRHVGNIDIGADEVGAPTAISISEMGSNTAQSADTLPLLIISLVLLTTVVHRRAAEKSARATWRR